MCCSAKSQGVEIHLLYLIASEHPIRSGQSLGAAIHLNGWELLCCSAKSPGAEIYLVYVAIEVGPASGVGYG